MGRVQRAVFSVSDKAGIVELGASLERHSIEIVSTGGTAKVLEEGGVKVIPIREITKNERDAYFSGRMKTISFQFESALLYDRNDGEHVDQARELGIKAIDIVVCNLYPFEKTVARDGCTVAEAIEQIDIGGPCMIRAGAKNWRSVAVITNLRQYPELLDDLQRNDGSLSDAFRLRCARAAFAMTASYDQAITAYLAEARG